MLRSLTSPCQYLVLLSADATFHGPVLRKNQKRIYKNEYPTLNHIIIVSHPNLDPRCYFWGLTDKPDFLWGTRNGTFPNLLAPLIVPWRKKVGIRKWSVWYQSATSTAPQNDWNTNWWSQHQLIPCKFPKKCSEACMARYFVCSSLRGFLLDDRFKC